MAKGKSKKVNSKIPIVDNSWWYSNLAMMPPEAKESALWCAQFLFFEKINSRTPLVDQVKASKYRKNANLDIDESIYRQMIDPITPMGGGGTAEYFASDFKALPIATHLRNIRKAKLDKIGLVNKPQVNEINKFSKSQRQKDKDKIIYKEVFRNLIIMIANDLGLPPLSKSESAEEYVQKLGGKEGTAPSDDVSRIMEQIKLQIKDDQDYALYERYVYKGEIERAFELGIQYYLINQNKWRIVSQLFNEDLVNFNKASGMWYVDNTTGRGVVKYLDPARLYTSPFRQKDGEDILYWFYEEPMSFGDFIREVGNTLTDEQLKEVFELNKYAGSNHGLDYEAGAQRRNNAMIMVGFSCVLSQDAEKFGEEYALNGSPKWERKPLDWQPDDDSSEIKQKIYNVWHSFYYIPPPSSALSVNTQADWVWQSRFIFNIQKVTDMYRYGVDRRFAKSPLVIWKDDQPSCTDIEEAILPKIYNTWHKFQNCLIQDTNAVIIDEDFVLGIINAVDESNPNDPNQPNTTRGSNGINAGLEAFRMMRQGGIALMKFRDKNGNVIPNLKPQDFFVNMDTKHIDKAEKYLQLIIQQYELLKMSLAQSDVTEGVGAKPRTAVAGIEASIEASNNAIWFVEFPVREFLIMFSERTIQYILALVKDKKVYKYEDRWKNFEEVVGLANALMIEGIEDIPIEDIGLTVSLEDTTAQQQYILALCNEMVTNNKIGYDGAMLAIETAKINYKYAFAIMGLYIKQREEEVAAQQEVQFQQQMQLQDKQLQIAQTLQGQKIQGSQQSIQLQGQVDAQVSAQLNDLKHQSQADLKAQTSQARIQENDNKIQKQADVQQQKSLI